LDERDSEIAAMRYVEHALPPALHRLAPSTWSLAQGDGNPPVCIEHEATPDGCVEIIRRHSGRSVWRRDQPELFVTGLGAAPVRFGFSRDARFTAVKLWPWAWETLGGTPCPGFADDWTALPADHPAASWLDGEADQAAELAAAAIADIPCPPIGEAVLAARTTAELRAATGWPARRLQRWFEAHIGLAPRTYLRVIRFQGSLRALGESPNLADHAAAHGYADQAHMARDFRRLAGTPPSDARRRAQGPFL
jgi:AraC-like DNA-binding protein